MLLNQRTTLTRPNAAPAAEGQGVAQLARPAHRHRTR
jgi:hypothetical protein